MKKLIQKIFGVFGYQLVNKKFISQKGKRIEKGIVENQGNSMFSAMKRVFDLGINPDIIIDMGAAKGTWTLKALKIWPKALFHLIEPLKEQIDQIDNSLLNNSRIKITEAVAGSKSGVVKFSISKDLDGSGVYGEDAGEQRQVKVVRLDELISKEDGSILLKLDTHGYEIPIFEGAEEILKNTSAIVVEVYGFHVSPTGLLFHEISEYLDRKGFRLVDIVDVMRRPKDNAFWQADAVYLKKTNFIFNDNNYK